MTNKVQKISEKVEKLKSNLVYGACSSQTAMETRCKEEAYDEVLAILDTMQEEPVSEVWHYANEHPEIEKPILLRKVNGVVELAICHDENFYPEIGEMWAYIDDILNLSNVKRTVKDWKEMPASEELDEAINTYIGHAPEIDECSSVYGKRQAFKAGAKWQEKQDQETIEVAEDHAMLAGMEKMKVQMMAKAIDGYVIEDIEEGNGDFLLSADYLPKSMGLKDQQRVKVIVIKED